MGIIIVKILRVKKVAKNEPGSLWANLFAFLSPEYEVEVQILRAPFSRRSFASENSTAEYHLVISLIVVNLVYLLVLIVLKIYNYSKIQVGGCHVLKKD